MKKASKKAEIWMERVKGVLKVTVEGDKPRRRRDADVTEAVLSFH
jgi:hypothetical protein